VQTQFQRSMSIAAFAIALSASGCAHQFHHHQSHDPHGHSHLAGDGLTVIGTGEAKGAPDVAHTSIGIEVRADTVDQATAQANQLMTAILGAIKSAGVADADLHTHDFSVSFERDFTPVPPQPVEAPKPTALKGSKAGATLTTIAAPQTPAVRGSYRVTNTVDVTIRDITRASAVLTAATSAGANNVWGISFDVQNPEPLHQQAREQAVAQAKRTAEQLAKLTGVKLGGVVTVDDQAEGVEGAQPRMFKALAATDNAQVPVQNGELTVTHQVRLVYAIDR